MINVVLLNSENEQSIAGYTYRDVSHKYYAAQENIDTKVHIPYESIHLEFSTM